MSSAPALMVLLAAVVASGCGGESAPAPAPEPEGIEVSGDMGEKPQITIPDEPPPDSLETEDVVEGDGAEAHSGDTLEVEYVGMAYGTGEEFDSSYGTRKPFRFELGAGQVIPGWDLGLDGMRVGGRRTLTIPPDLAYGVQGAPPAIGPNETLVFVVDLIEVAEKPGRR